MTHFILHLVRMGTQINAHTALLMAASLASDRPAPCHVTNARSFYRFVLIDCSRWMFVNVTRSGIVRSVLFYYRKESFSLQH